MERFQIKHWDSGSHARIGLNPTDWNCLQESGWAYHRFFRQSDSVKKKYWLGDAPIPFRGYFPPFRQNYDSEMLLKDYKEGFDIGLDLLSCQGRVNEYQHFYGPNLFPSEVPELQTMALTTYHLMQQISEFVRGKVWESLKYDDTQVSVAEQGFETSISTLRALYYNSDRLREMESGPKVPVASHTDPGFFTIIHSVDAACGLEFHNGSGWEEFLPEVNEVLVHWGDFLQLISGGRFTANKHRVVEKPQERLSQCFFHNPDYSARFPIKDSVSEEAGRQIFCCSIGYSGNEEELYRDHMDNRLT